MKKILSALVIGAVLGAGIFLLWWLTRAALTTAPVERAAGLPTSEAELKEGEYFDLRGRKEVLVSIQDSTFNPRIIIADKGVNIFWKNEDAVPHFIGLDIWSTPPRELPPAGAFSVVLNEPGFYSYNGDAGVEDMKGIIIVK